MPETDAMTPSILEPVLILPKRKTRSLSGKNLDREEVVADALKRLSLDLDDRAEWMNDYTRRYAKYRGWIEPKTYQFEDAPNAHIPEGMYTCQRVEDSIYNAVMAQQPPLQSEAVQKQDATKEQRIDNLLFHQIFGFANGAKIIGDAVHNYVVDGTVQAFIPWVRGSKTVRLFERLPTPEGGTDLLTYLQQQFTRLYGPTTAILNRDNHKFLLANSDGTFDVEVYEGVDGDLELVEQRDIRIDHLGLQVEDIEDIVVPSNCENPQPPSESNPRGAHHVFKLCRASLDTIRVRKENGIYDLLTKEDLARIEQWADQQTTDDTALPKEQKDEMEGVESQAPLAKHGTVRIVECYDRWDVDGDGLEEDVIFWIVCNGGATEGVLARARYLTEIIPLGPNGPRRPIEKEVLFPIPNRYYGMSLLEMIEGIQDLTDLFFNLAAESGVIANSPWFFYRASSSMKAENIRLQPGMGYPVDDPRGDVHFPTIQSGQGTWFFSMLAMLTQVLDRLTMLSGLSYGSIPTGKSAALRTSENMRNVLQQTDVRSEHVLRRFFEFLSRIWDQGLALCQRYLPPNTEFRLLGVPESHEQFDRVQDRKDIAGRFRFKWRATMLNTNPMLQQQAALQLLQTVATPLMIQAQIVGPAELYHAMRHFIETLQEPNPDQYLKRPPEATMEPKITAEQAISMIMNGKAPTTVNAVEPLEDHARKLGEFLQSDAIALLDEPGKVLFREYVTKVSDSLRRMQMQAQMAQAAQGFQQGLGGGMGQNGGGPQAGAPDMGALMGMSQASPAEGGEIAQGGG